MTKTTGTCRYCNRQIAVCKDGSIKSHGHFYVTGKTKIQRTDNCPGSFIPSKETENNTADAWLAAKIKAKEERRASR